MVLINAASTHVWATLADMKKAVGYACSAISYTKRLIHACANLVPCISTRLCLYI